MIGFGEGSDMGIKEREESRVTSRFWLQQWVDSHVISGDGEVLGGTGWWAERIKYLTAYSEQWDTQCGARHFQIPCHGY